MARNYKPRPHKSLALLCVIMAFLLAAACTLGGLELWGTDKMKPSNWGKQDELAPVTISFTDDAPAPFGIVQTLENGARAYPLMTTASASYPSSKTAIAECTLPEGGTPDLYKWSITGGEGLSVRPIPDSSAAIITAQNYFTGAATLTVRAYRGSELRGIGSISITAQRAYETSDIVIEVYYLKNGSEEYQRMLSDFRAFPAGKYGFQVNFVEFTQFEACYEREPDYAVFLDEENAIAYSGDASIMQDIGITCFFYNMDVDQSLGYFLVEDMLAPEGIESALRSWAEQCDEIYAFFGDLTIEHQDIIQQIADSEGYTLQSVSDYEGWQGLIDSGNPFNCIMLSSSAELPDVMDVIDGNGISHEDIMWIICDVRDEEAQMVSGLISEGASVCAYKKVAHFDLIFDAIYDIEAGESLSEDYIYLYTYEAFV